MAHTSATVIEHRKVYVEVTVKVSPEGEVTLIWEPPLISTVTLTVKARKQVQWQLALPWDKKRKLLEG